MSTPLKHWLAAFLAAVLATLTPPSLADETFTYIHWDALGSPVAATDEAGNVVWRESYRPYGERIDNEVAAGNNSRWYTGHPQDADTGLVYAGARYYDPVIGRFLAKDPVAFQADNLHSFNRYTYANNNPYSYIDPDGREGVGPAFVMQDGDRFTGAFGTSGSVEQGTQQVVTILETADTVSSVFMPAKGAATFFGKQAGKFIKKNVTRGGVQANRAAGEAFERQVKARLQQTQSGVVDQVTVRTQSGVRTRLDLLGRDASGAIRCTECKSSATAPLTRNQRLAFPEIQQSGGVVVGRGKPGFPGGTEIPPTRVEIIGP